MCKLRDAEAKLMLAALPSGILAKIKGATLDEAGTRYHTTLRALMDKGYVAEHTVGVDSDVRHPMIAYYITQDGYNALLGCLPDDHPLQACSDVSVNIRGRMSANKVQRMARMATAADMMMCAGVRLPLDCIADGLNPYVLGSGRECSDCVTLGDHVRTAMQAAAAGLPPVDSGWVYIPADMIHHDAMVSGGTQRPGGRQKRHYNDALGVLMDLDRRSYLVLTKTATRYGDYWPALAHRRLTWHMERLMPRGAPKIGVVLCDTAEAMLHKAVDAGKYDEPYRHVLPITTDWHGLQMLDNIMAVGVEAYVRQHVDEALAASPDLHERHLLDPNPLWAVYRGNVRCFVGTVIDYRIIGYMQRTREAYCLVCYASQRGFYEALAKPKEIIVIPDR